MAGLVRAPREGSGMPQLPTGMVTFLFTNPESSTRVGDENHEE